MDRVVRAVIAVELVGIHKRSLGIGRYRRRKVYGRRIWGAYFQRVIVLWKEIRAGDDNGVCWGVIGFVGSQRGTS